MEMVASEVDECFLLGMLLNEPVSFDDYLKKGVTPEGSWRSTSQVALEGDGESRARAVQVKQDPPPSPFSFSRDGRAQSPRLHV